MSEDKIVNFVQRLKEKRAALEEAAHENQKQITARDREFDIAIGELFGGLAAIHTHFVKHASDDPDVVESPEELAALRRELADRIARGEYTAEALAIIEIVIVGLEDGTNGTGGAAA